MLSRTSLLLLIVCSLSMIAPPLFAQDMGIDPVSLPLLKPYVAVNPAEIIVGEKVSLIVLGYLPGYSYQFVPPEEPIVPIERESDNSFIPIQIQVLETTVPNPDRSLEIRHEIILEDLKPGGYEVILFVNGNSAYQTKFFVYDTPPPVSRPVQVYGASLAIEPVYPKPGEEFSIYAMGEFPSAGYTITHTSVAMTKSIPEMVIVNLEVEAPVDAAATVMVPFRELAGTLQLTEGNHPIQGFINGEPFYSGTLSIENEPGTIPNPQSLFNSASLTFVPAFPRPDEIFSVYVTGEFPTSGYEITSKEVSVDVENSFITYTLNVATPTGPQDLVISPFRELITTDALPRGKYGVEASINGLTFYSNTLIVDEYSPISQGPIIYPKVYYDPPQPNPGEPFSVYVTGEFPTPGYSFSYKALNVLESEPEQVSIELVVERPTEPQAEVITPYDELVGTVTLGEGLHPIRGTVNDIPFYADSLRVGEDPNPMIVKLERTGGIASEHTNLSIFRDGTYQIVWEKKVRDMIAEGFASIGQLPDEIFAELSTLLETTPFDTLEIRYVPEEPIADGYSYWLQVGDAYAFSIIQGAALPEDLQHLLDMLETLMDDNVPTIPDIPEPPLLIYDMKLVYDPASPNPNEEFTLYLTGEFPTSGYSIADTKISIAESYPEQVFIEVTVKEPEDVVLDVLTPFREKLGSIALGEGSHPIIVSIDGDVTYKDILYVGIDPVAPMLYFERSGGFAGFFTSMILYRNGFVEFKRDPNVSDLPLSGQVQTEIMDQILNTLTIVSFDTLESEYRPETPIMDGYNFILDYVNRFRVAIAQGAEIPPELGELVRILTEILDGHSLETLDEPVSPGMIYNSSVVIAPSMPKPNEEFSIYLVGEFPTPGYTFVDKSIAIAESYPEQLFVKITITEPEGPVATVIQPFRELIGTTALGAGRLPINVDVNGERIYSGIIVVGDAPEEALINFQRSGGLSGHITSMALYRSGYVEITSDPDSEDQVTNGQVLSGPMNELLTLLNSSSLDSWDGNYQPPSPVADGYNYNLNYNNTKNVNVDQGAAVPSDLDAVLAILEGIIDGTLLSRAEDTTAVSGWMSM